MGKFWTEERLGTMKECFEAKMSDKEIAAYLSNPYKKITASAITNQRCLTGLKRGEQPVYLYNAREKALQGMKNARLLRKIMKTKRSLSTTESKQIMEQLDKGSNPLDISRNLSRVLGRSKASVYMHAYRLLKKHNRSFRKLDSKKLMSDKVLNFISNGTNVATTSLVGRDRIILNDKKNASIMFPEEKLPIILEALRKNGFNAKLNLSIE